MVIIKSSENVYFIGKDLVMNRSYGMLPNQLPAGGCWVIYNIKTGEMIDYSRYSNDLLEKYENKA